MSYSPNNPNGQAVAASSAPVVLASDQVGSFVSGTPNSTATALAVAGTTESHAWSVSAVQAGTTYDVGNLAWVSVQVTAQYTGTTPTITFQTSNDAANWQSAAMEQVGAGQAGAASTTTSGSVTFHGPLSGRYFRLNFTGAYTSGTSTGTITFFSVPRALNTIGVAAASTQSGAWNVGLAAATTGGYSSGVISTATTTTVKSGAGTLHTISILGGTAGAIDVYDNTAGSGTKLVPTFTPGSVSAPATLTFDVAFATGLTIVTGAATLLQVSYK